MEISDQKVEEGADGSANRNPNKAVPTANAGQRTECKASDKTDSPELLAERQALVIASMAELLGATDLERALDAFSGALQHRFKADRIALLLVNDKDTVVLKSISQQARIDSLANETRLLQEVSLECLEHERTICFPSSDSELGVLFAHRALAEKNALATIVSLPLYVDAVAVGAVIIEQYGKQPYSSEVIKLLEHISLLAAPLLVLRQAAERTVLQSSRAAFKSSVTKHFGKGREGSRFILATGCLMLTLATLVPLPQRIVATAELVPLERRLITAPFDGYIKDVEVVSGDSIVAGQVLARLERRELELEGSRRDGEIASAEADFRAAMASYDRQATAVARARLDRERAARAIVDQRLARIEIRAPSAGLIINSNANDVIGAPISRGDPLFEIARAEEYEVHLLVHERDIRDVKEGQQGTLRLRSRPGEELTLKTHAIHPVAENIDGASRFRVRATLNAPKGASPRPGESGIAHLQAGRGNLLKLLGEPVLQRLTELWWRLSA